MPGPARPMEIIRARLCLAQYGPGRAVPQSGLGRVARGRPRDPPPLFCLFFIFNFFFLNWTKPKSQT